MVLTELSKCVNVQMIRVEFAVSNPKVEVVLTPFYISTNPQRAAL